MSSSSHGFGVLTFHLPFIIAATALGGPVAGGWVAMISTLEARELREVPWYGTLANHSAMALSAVLGGIVYAAVREGPLGDITDQPQAAQLVAIVLATFVLSGLSASLATGTVILRDGLSLREAGRLLDTSYRKTAASEVVLGWVLAVAYGSVGWWAALVCATLVLVVWQAHIDRERARHDAMTGLLSRTGFDARLAEVLVGVGRGAGRIALLAIDLDRFKAVNDEYGHGTGDQVIREVGARLQASVRLTDAAVRLGGDEFGVLLVGVSDAAAAEALAWKIHRSLCEPIETDRAIDHDRGVDRRLRPRARRTDADDRASPRDLRPGDVPDEGRRRRRAGPRVERPDLLRSDRPDRPRRDEPPGESAT